MTTLSEAETEQRDEFVQRLFLAAVQSIDLLSMYLGDRLGLYDTLRATGAATAGELAARAGIHERYAREWLEQQGVAGILAVDDPTAAPTARRYRLPQAHAEVLTDRDSLNYLAPLARVLGAIGPVLPALLEAYRTGGGVPWSAYGDDMRMGQERLNRPSFLYLLTDEWLPAIPDVHARLQSAQGARVADIGCGAGWSSIAIARAYPAVRVDGFDVDAPSIAVARENAMTAGVADRVSFHVRDVAEGVPGGPYDLVTAFECIHDLSRPVEVLQAMRRLAGDDGAVLVMDERVGETFTAPADEIERFMYGASLLVCLPTGMAEQPSAATGTVMRPSTLRRYAVEAGFRAVEVLPIEHPFFRFYRLLL